MADSLSTLESKRSLILIQFNTVGDLRPGLIRAGARRCGKPAYHCAKPNDPGHDTQIRLTRKVNRKIIAESCRSPAAYRKAHAGIDE